MLKKKILFYIILPLLILMQVIPADASNSFTTRVTSKEKAVFAFFRALGTSPDYEYWISSKHTYNTLSPREQENYLLQETMRLGGGYGLYDQDIDLLELKINVLAKYIPSVDGKKPRILFNFFDTSKEYTPTFNYPYGKDTLSLVINRLAMFSNMSLNETQNAAILSKIPYENEDFEATLVVHVRISKVNYKHPVTTSPNNHWLMVGEVAYLKCNVRSYEGNEEHMLWDYVAPWHEEIFRIKNTPEEEKYPHPFDLYKD